MLFNGRVLPIIVLSAACLYIFVTLIVYQIATKSNKYERIMGRGNMKDDRWHNDEQQQKLKRHRHYHSKDEERIMKERGIDVNPPEHRLHGGNGDQMPRLTKDRGIDRSNYPPDEHHLHNRRHNHVGEGNNRMMTRDKERRHIMEFENQHIDNERIEDQDNPAYKRYTKLRTEFDEIFPSPRENEERLLKMVEKLRKHSYKTVPNMPYDIYNCPITPPDGYPYAWRLYDDIITHWNPDTPTPPPDNMIHQGLCVFDYQTEIDKAQNYREAEVPFILRNDPSILSIVERWNHPDYLPRLLGSTQTFKAEHSTTNHFMFFRVGRNRPPPDWTQPVNVDYDITFTDWLTKAKASQGTLKHDEDHIYFRLNGCKDSSDINKCISKNGASSYYITKEIPFFSSEHRSFYIVDPNQFRGINCRFGMTGIIAENHFDGSRNMVILFGGERRYILAHPNQCPNLELHPKGHPSGRHSKVDWSNPDFNKYPNFRKAYGNEVVLQAGDLMYLPTFWFHYIISLDGVNYQCNARSGITDNYANDINRCGF